MTSLIEDRMINLPEGTDDVGRISVRIRVANNAEMIRASAGDIPSTDVHQIEVDAVVDTGAVRLVLPKATVDALGLPVTGSTQVRYADHRTATRDVVQNVWLECADRQGIFSAIVEPQRTEALVGAIVMEELDLIADCRNRRLLPRDPDTTISEVE